MELAPITLQQRVHRQGDDGGAGTETETDAPWYVFTTNNIYLAD